MGDVTPPLDYFTGPVVRLLPLEADDLALVRSWINDERIAAFNGPRWPVSEREQAGWYERLVRDERKRKLVIADAEGRRAGLVSLHDIDHRHGNAEVGVYVAPDLQGRGLARAALHMLLRFAFGELNLVRVHARILGFNERSMRLFEALGFQREGVLREHAFCGGRLVDVHLFGLLRRDFAA
jgi:RimJ/RimL family protein N-acetyltransferase